MESNFSIEAEQAVLGRGLVSPSDMAELATSLRADWFYRESHRAIFAAMLEALQGGKCANIATVTDALEAAGDLEKLDGGMYLFELVDFDTKNGINSPVADSVAIIIEKAQKRDLLMMYAKAQAMAMEGTKPGEIQDFITTRTAEIEAYGAITEAARKPYAGLTLSEMDGATEMDWLIAGILPDHVTSGMFGDSESGKSLAVLDICMRIALGWPWRGREIKQGHVWYVAAEGYMGIRYRMHAWLQHYNVAQEAIDPYVHVVGQGVPLMQPAEVSKLIARIREHPYQDSSPLLVVLDTLSRCMEGGDENDNSDMRDALVQAERIHRETGAVVLIIHHAGKNDQYRGASAFRANLDTVLKVEQKDGKVLMYCDKQKDGAPKFPTISSEIVSVTRDDWADLSFPVLVPSEYEPPQQADTDPRGNLRLMLLVLGDRPLKYNDWMEAAKQNGVKQSSFKERRKQAVKRGMVIQDGEWYKLSETAQAWYENLDTELPDMKNTVLRTQPAPQSTYPKGNVVDFANLRNANPSASIGGS